LNFRAKNHAAEKCKQTTLFKIKTRETLSVSSEVNCEISFKIRMATVLVGRSGLILTSGLRFCAVKRLENQQFG
jgi:hypothetical protein